MHSTQNDSMIPRFIMAGIVAFGAVSAFFVLRQPIAPSDRISVVVAKSAHEQAWSAAAASAAVGATPASGSKPAEAPPTAAAVPQSKAAPVRTTAAKPAPGPENTRAPKTVAARATSASAPSSVSADFTPRVRVVDTLPARAAAAPPSPATKPAVAAAGSGFKPVVVAVTADKVWVKVDQTRTVIVNKDETFHALGKYQGPDANGGAKFENGVLPSAF